MRKSKSSVFQFAKQEIQVHGRTAVLGELVFSDIKTRNSFRVTTAREFLTHIKKIEKTCDVLVFRAEGRIFCSGGNLKDHVEQGAVRGKTANREIAMVLSSLNELKIPTLALVEGDVFGGGLELLSAFDVVWSVPHVMFGFWQRRMGLAFGWGGGARLSRRMGASIVSRYALEARAVTTLEAKRIGLVDRIVFGALGARGDRAIFRAELARLATLPKAAVAALKQSRQVSLAEARAEQKVFEKLWFAPDHRAALEAFSVRLSSRTTSSRARQS